MNDFCTTDAGVTTIDECSKQSLTTVDPILEVVEQVKFPSLFLIHVIIIIMPTHQQCDQSYANLRKRLLALRETVVSVMHEASSATVSGPPSTKSSFA